MIGDHGASPCVCPTRRLWAEAEQAMMTLGPSNFSQIEILAWRRSIGRRPIHIPVGYVTLFLFGLLSRGEPACELIAMPRMCNLSVYNV